MADFRLVVVSHLEGAFELNARGHELSIFAAAVDEELDPLPPFDPPDIAALEERWSYGPDEPARFRIEGGRLDLNDFQDAIAAARARDAAIEFHLF